MIYAFADCILDTDRFELRRGGQRLGVEPKVLDLLILLIENRHRMLSKDEIFDRVWEGRIVSDAALSTAIKAARQAIGDDGRQQRLIETAHGRGFRFRGELIRADAPVAAGAGAAEAGMPAPPALPPRVAPPSGPTPAAQTRTPVAIRPIPPLTSPSAATQSAGALSAESGPVPANGMAEELRELAIVCALAPGEDPEAHAEAAARLCASAARLAERHGAMPISSPDADTLIVFGLDRGGADDRERAIAAAQALSDAEPSARIGVAAGRTLVAAGPPVRISGEARRRALALAMAAAPGQISVAPELAQAGPEGAPERVKAPPFVGRSVERRQLLTLIETAGIERAGAVALLTGAAGIGKTRLARAAAKDATGIGGRVAIVGFSGFGEERESFAERLARRLAAAGGPRSRPGAAPAEAAALATLLGRPVPPGGQALLAAMDEARLAETTAGVLAAMATEGLAPDRAALLIVEDAHWADRAELDLILRLAALIADRPAVMIVTERPGEARFGPLIRRAPVDTEVLRLELSPLPARVARRIAWAMGCADETFVEEAVRRAEGNALFLVRLLQAGPALLDQPPPSIVSLVQAQTHGLPEAERQTLRRAAILGQGFAEADFRAVFGPADFGHLIQRGFLVRDGERLAFGHALMHEAVLTGITRADRALLHAGVAAHFRGRDAVKWAEHALLAGAHDAAAACAAAADTLLPRYEFARGERMIEAGLAAPGGDGDARAMLLLCRGSLRRERGDLEGALADYEAGTRESAGTEVRLQNLIRESWIHRLRGDLDLADARLDAAEALDRTDVAPDYVSELWNQRGNQAFARGRVAECQRYHAMAAEYAERPLWRARALGGLGDAHYAAGRMRTARACFEDCIRMAREHGLGLVEMANIFMAPVCAHFADPGPAVLAAMGAAIERARAVGNARAELIGLIDRAESRLIAGDPAGCAEDLERIEPLVERLGSTRFAAEIDYTRAQLALTAGRPAEARALLPADAAAVPAGVRGYLGAPLLGLAAVAAGEAGAARRLIDAGAALLGEAAVGHCHLWFRQHAIEAALRFRLWDVAAAEADALAAYTAAEPLTWSDLVIQRGRLLARAGAGGATPALRAEASRLADALEAAAMGALAPELRTLA